MTRSMQRSKVQKVLARWVIGHQLILYYKRKYAPMRLWYLHKHHPGTMKRNGMFNFFVFTPAGQTQLFNVYFNHLQGGPLAKRSQVLRGLKLKHNYFH